MTSYAFKTTDHETFETVVAMMSFEIVRKRSAVTGETYHAARSTTTARHYLDDAAADALVTATNGGRPVAELRAELLAVADERAATLNAHFAK